MRKKAELVFLCGFLVILLTRCSSFSIFKGNNNSTVVSMHPSDEVPMALPPGAHAYEHTFPQHRGSFQGAVEHSEEEAMDSSSDKFITAAPKVEAPSLDPMDSVDLKKRSQALESSRSNDVSSWYNPNTDMTYVLTPRDTFTNKNGQTCRQYTLVKSKAGVRSSHVEQACRLADGSWSD